MRSEHGVIVLFVCRGMGTRGGHWKKSDYVLCIIMTERERERECVCVGAVEGPDSL